MSLPFPPISMSAEVAAARRSGRSIVALESAIVTHGMPYPTSLETALSVEADIREGGAVPATIAVIDGRLCVGLESVQLEILAKRGDVAKLSRADLGVSLARGITGSTTVAATMIAARAAGINVFATGGVGGVHRWAEATFDISADLTELAQTRVTVVCAGPKAILDLPKTLEVLETNGVPVISVGQDILPAFWSRNSGILAPQRLDDPGEIAASSHMRARLRIPGGQLVALPIPFEAEIPAETLTPLIAQAMEEAAAQGITGKAVTPFLLRRIFELTDGRSLDANIALVRNNARFAARIARKFSMLAR